MRSATAIITEIRSGELANELSEALANALQSVQEVGNKDAVVTVKITISPLTKMQMSEPAVSYTGEVTTKLAKAEPQETIFFIGADGDPTRQPSRQADLGLTIAGKESKAS